MENRTELGRTEIDVKVIGLLLAGETSLHVFPTDSKMIESAIQTLNKVPGVLSCTICVKGISSPVGNLDIDKCNACDLKPTAIEAKENPLCQHSEMEGFNTLSLRTTMNFFGFLIMKIEDAGEYQPYSPFVENFANAISVVMENRQQKSQLAKQNEELERHRDNLEKLVKERTDALEKSELLLSTTQQISKVGGWEYDIEKNNVYWTDEMYHIHGFDSNTITNDVSSHIQKSLECYRPEDRPIIMKAFENCVQNGKEYDLEYPITKFNGAKIWIRTTAKPVFAKGKIVKVIGNFMDITDQKKSYQTIKNSLKEKETLLYEIHHRVKNNMQVINSLLKLQANSIDDQNARNILKDSQNRVYAMAAVHETLHGSNYLSEINLKSYISKITTAVFQAFSADHQKVVLKSEVENSPISINQAYPLGLIINELISNSLKYAFPKDREGEISVSMKKFYKELELVIMDDGVGISDNFNWKNAKTLGLKLVRTLVENQLNGSVDMESKNGTKFTIKFAINKI
ncbi:PAS domain-containing protein [bacterium]|nr:PAS domain-containing protein [bacterium]